MLPAEPAASPAGAQLLANAEWMAQATLVEVQALLDQGASPTARDQYGNTPLHRAARFNDPAVIALLLDRGADPKLRSKEGKLPVDYAAENEKLQGTDVYWRLTVLSSGAPASENLSPDVDHLPFIQALRHLETREQKRQHLRSWNHARGPQNGLPEHEARHFERLLALSIFHHVDDNGVLNCQTLGENLARVMPDRYEAGCWYTFTGRVVQFEKYRLSIHCSTASCASANIPRMTRTVSVIFIVGVWLPYRMSAIT